MYPAEHTKVGEIIAVVAMLVVALAVPLTSRVYAGEVVPIPTLQLVYDFDAPTVHPPEPVPAAVARGLTQLENVLKPAVVS